MKNSLIFVLIRLFLENFYCKNLFIPCYIFKYFYAFT